MSLDSEDHSLQEIFQELSELRARVERIEEDTASSLLVQNRILTTINDLQTSILKLRESVIRLRDRVG